MRTPLTEAQLERHRIANRRWYHNLPKAICPDCGGPMTPRQVERCRECANKMAYAKGGLKAFHERQRYGE